MIKTPFPLYFLSLSLLQDHFSIKGAEYIYNYIDTFRKEREQSDGKKYKVVIVEEKEYVDAFFLRDYANYYAEAIARTNKMTQRLHFFLFYKEELEEFNKILLEALSTGDRNTIDMLNSLYIGFITIKPIPDEKGKKSVGKCFIKPYPSASGRRLFIKCRNLNCSLGGIKLAINTIPFHQQDIAVGACASATLWMAQFPINEYFPVPIHSLAEITHISSYPYRKAPLYPNKGLHIEEINKYLLDLGLQFHTVELQVLHKEYKKLYGKGGTRFIINSLLHDAIRSYIEGGFPIIASLSLKRGRGFFKDVNEDLEWHAALITGYRIENDEIVEIYMHDDGICPYSRAYFGRKTLTIVNEWKTEHNYETTLHTLIIPVPPILRFSITQLYEYLLSLLSREIEINFIPLLEDFKRHGWPTVRLLPVNRYKEELLSIKIKKCMIKSGEKSSMEEITKIEYLAKNSPKYLWILQFKEGYKRIKDIVIDATLSVPEILATIHYV